jgi:uncharacterized membrane protein (DUF373 family)
VKGDTMQASQRDEPLVIGLKWVIRQAVRVLSVLMTAVIIMGVVDVVWVLYKRLTDDSPGLLEISDILATFGAFMAVLIAIEIFVNITSYLRDDIIHVRLVVATALMAVARKVIVLDFGYLSWEYVFGIAAVLVATAFAYWIVAVQGRGADRYLQHEEWDPRVGPAAGRAAPAPPADE